MSLTKISFSAEETVEALIVPVAAQLTQDYGIRTETVMVGTTNITVVHPARKISKSGKSRPVDGFPTPTGAVKMSDTTVTPRPIEAFLPFKSAAFVGSNWEKALPAGVFKNDISRGDKILAYILGDRVMEGFYSDILRLFWFGNEASGNPDYNTFTGVWKKVYDAYNASGTTITPYKLTPNAALSSGQAIDIFNGLMDNAPDEMKDLFSMDGFQSGMEIWCTQQIYQNYLRSLSTVSSDESYTTLENGQRVRVWNGFRLRIIPRGSSDALESGVFGSGVTSNVNWAFMATTENLVCNFDAQLGTSIYNANFDEYMDTYFARAKCQVAGTYITSELISVAFPTT